MRGNEVVNGQAIQCYEIRVCKGETPGFDRWTVVYIDQPERAVNTFACVGMSRHSACMIGPHLGTRIPFSELPLGLQCSVVNDTSEVNSGKRDGVLDAAAAAKLVAIRQGIPYRWRSINDREIDLEIALNPLPREGE